MQRNLERFIAFLFNHLLRTARKRVGYGKAHSEPRSQDGRRVGSKPAAQRLVGIKTQDARNVLEKLIKESTSFRVLSNLRTLTHFLNNSFEFNRIVSVNRLLQLVDLVHVFHTPELSLLHVEDFQMRNPAFAEPKEF